MHPAGCPAHESVKGAIAVTWDARLHVGDTMSGYFGEEIENQPPPRVKLPKNVDEHSELFELIGSPFLANLRHFQMGDEVPDPDGWCDCHCYARGL